jgi:hypothetical protein
LRGDCLIKHVTEGKLQGRIEVTRRRGRTEAAIGRLSGKEAILETERGSNRLLWKMLYRPTCCKMDYRMNESINESICSLGSYSVVKGFVTDGPWRGHNVIRRSSAPLCDQSEVVASVNSSIVTNKKTLTHKWLQYWYYKSTIYFDLKKIQSNT